MSVAEILSEIFTDDGQRSLIVTLGNCLRSDDGAGPYLAERLRLVSGLCVENVGEQPERAIDMVQQHLPQQVVFVDAAAFGAAPGRLKRIAMSDIVTRSLSTHRLPLTIIVDWIEQEYAINCYCLGIQPESMQLGEALSPAVLKTVEEIVSWFQQKGFA